MLAKIFIIHLFKEEITMKKYQGIIFLLIVATLIIAGCATTRPPKVRYPLSEGGYTTDYHVFYVDSVGEAGRLELKNKFIAYKDSVKNAGDARLAEEKKQAYNDSVATVKRLEDERLAEEALGQLAGKNIYLARSIGGQMPSDSSATLFTNAGVQVVRKAKWYRRTPYATVQVYFNPDIYSKSKCVSLSKQIRDLFDNKRPVNYNTGAWATANELERIRNEYGNDVILVIYDWMPSGDEPEVPFGMEIEEYHEWRNTQMGIGKGPK